MKFPAALRSPDLLAIFPTFYIPLILFTSTHDQFELPKTTFLALTAVLMALFSLLKPHSKRPSPLSIALAFFLATQVLASLPATSLSWRASLLGDYENFRGLAALCVLMVLFLFYGRALTLPLFEKIVFFNSLAALLSSFYALAQHFGWDLIPWNPGSVTATREFAAMGNPNFLAAYLAISFPFYLSWCLKKRDHEAPKSEWAVFTWSGALWGFLILLLSTPAFSHHFGFGLPPETLFPVRILGFAFLSLGLSSILRSLDPWARTGMSLFLLLGLVSTGSRGGFLGALAGGILWGVMTWKDPERSQKIRAKIASMDPIALGATVLLPGLALGLVGHGFLARLAHSVLNVHQSFADSRLSIWGPAWRMALAHPLTGVGLDTFKIAFPAYSGTDFNHTDGLFVSSRMAHDQWLQLASTTGFLGLFSYLGVLAAWAWMGRRCYQKGTKDERLWLTAVFAGGLAYQTQAFFSFDVAALDLLWVLILSLVQNLHRAGIEDQRTRVWVPVWTWGVRTFLVLFIVVGLYFPVTRLGADLAFARGESASQVLTQLPNTTELSTVMAYSDYELAHLKKAQALCPLEVKYRLYLGLAYEQRSQLEPSVRKGFLILAQEQYEEVLRMSPSNSYYYNDLGRVETALGAFDPPSFENAEKAYRRTCELDPVNPLFRMNWSDALKKVGKKEEAEAQEQKAYTLDPLFTAKYQAQRALDLYQQKDIKTALGLLETTVQKAPQSPEAWYCLGILELSEGKKPGALKAFQKVKELGVDPAQDPNFKNLDALIEQAKN